MTYDVKREETLTVVPLYENVKCDGCDKPLEYAFDETVTSWPRLDPDEGVTLRIAGNYPSLWDDYNQAFLLCETCVETLGKCFPTIAKAMKQWQEAGT